MAGLRVVLDTNVLVSGLAYPASIPGHILSAWRQGGIDLVLSRFILDEMVRVLPRLRRIAHNRPVLSVKRSASASPATGSAKAHAVEQKTLLVLAFTTQG